MKQSALAACGLGLSLLAGCVIIPDDPPNDPPPPADAGPLPPVDAAPPPSVDAGPPLPPPPSAINEHIDAYDLVNDRVLVPDCPNNALLSVDAATGERTVLVDTWPWAEPGSTSCVQEVVVARDGQRAYATVQRSFSKSEDQSCTAEDFVSIDTATGEVTPIENIRYSCGDPTNQELYSVQIDAYYERLLYLYDACNPNACDYGIFATPLGGGPRERVHVLYPLPCFPDEDGCVIDSYDIPKKITFDPAQPDKRVLVLAQPHLNTSPYHGDLFMQSIDTVTGEVAETIPIQSTWDMTEEPNWDTTKVGALVDVTLDPENWRVLATVVGGEERGPTAGEPRWMVISLNRYTGAQTMLYYGTPTADGAKLSCSPDVSFDTRRNRLLMIEPPGGYGCEGNAFALDLATGTLSHL